MSTIEISVQEHKKPKELTPQEQAAEIIAQRFFGAIDDVKSTAAGPVFIAYFMEEGESHSDTELDLVRAVTELCAHPDSNCVSMVDTEKVILASLESGNQLVVSEQPEAGARSYWVCAPGQEPSF